MNDEDVIAKAIELPHEQRVGFLEGVYLNRPHDRAQMEAMPATHEQGDSLLDAEHLESTEYHQSIGPRSSQQTPKVHDTIGNYKLLQRIGDGGFGVVSMAEQSQPVKRTVARKVIPRIPAVEPRLKAGLLALGSPMANGSIASSVQPDAY